MSTKSGINTKTICVIVAAFAVVTWFAIRSRAYYNEDHPILNEISRRFSVLNPKYGDIPLKTGSKSYTEDKSAITLCIVNPKTKQFYDINVLMYVALHELSHCITKADGSESHGDEFKENFTMLLNEAAKKHVYDPTKQIPATYCGVESH
jgi:hypothetical protein